MDVVEDSIPELQELVELYRSVGWYRYTNDPHRLLGAIANSSFVVGLRHDSKLVGLARCLSDSFDLVYLADLLVHPSHQGKGWGRALVQACFRRFPEARRVVLMTDDSTKQARFYERLGFTNASKVGSGLITFMIEK